MTSAPRHSRRERIAALVGLVLVATTMRTAVGAISPIIDRISQDVTLDHVTLSVIASAPPLIFAMSGLVAPVAARHLGLERALLVAILVGAAGHLMRAVAPDSVTLTIGTALALLGAGVSNVLLPPIVKRYFPDRIGVMTAVYVTLLSVGATIPPALGVPLADTIGWRASLGLWSAWAVVAAIPWVVEVAFRRRKPDPRDAATREIEVQPLRARDLFHSPVAWSIALLFATPSLGAYFAFAWLPSMLREIAGVADAQAGVLLGVFAFCGFPAAIIVPILAARLRSAAPLIAAGLAFFVAAYLGFLLAPASAPLLWTIFTGFGPLLFPLALTLINLRSRTQAGSIALSGFVQGIGYVVGALGPLIVGLLRDATGGWTVPLFFLLGALTLAIPALIVLRHPHFVEDDLRR